MKNTSLGALVCLLSANGCNAVIDPTIEPIESGVARVRVAHLSPDAPAVDFCIAPAGTQEFAGPVLGGAGAPLGISYANVTKYLEVDAIRYDVRIVAPASADCSRALLPDVTDLPELPAGASATIAAIGKLEHDGTGEPFAVRAYIDDATVPADQAKLRFVHASPGTPAVDVGLGGGALFQAVFPNIEFGGIRAEGNGYITTPPISGAEISARVSGTLTDVLSITPASLPAGAIATAFAIGQVGSEKAPLGVLLCLDNNPAHGIETECSVVGAPPARARIRVAHLSPDAPAVDVCVKPSGGAYTRPVLAGLGATAGLSYPQITTYVEVPPARYDIRIVVAGDPSGCANAAVADTQGVNVAQGITATVAAIGVLDRSGAASHDPGFKLAVFADATSTAAGKGKLRFIHASPGTPAVDVGLGVAHGFTRVFANVAFGGIAANVAPIDALGFAEVSPFTAPVTARLAGATTDALTVPNVSLGAGQIATAFAIGGKTGSTTNPLRVLLCDDRKSAGLLTSCAVAP